MKRLLVAAVLVALVVGSYYYGNTFGDFLFGSKAPEAKGPRAAPAQAVVADVATETAAPIEVRAIGSVQSIAMVVIKSRVDGQIAEVNFEEGQDVKEGDLLFTIDNRTFEAQLAQSQAQLARDRAQYDRAELELRRQTDLASRAAATQQKLEDAQMAQRVYDAAMHADEAAIENAKVNLSYTTIRSPITGRAGAVNLKRGNVVKSNDTTTNAVPLVTITQMKPIYVTFTVPERHLSDIRAAFDKSEHLPVVVAIPGQPEPIPGTLTFIDNQVDVATGTIALKATFPNDDLRLWPGQFVNVTLKLGVQPNAVVVPSAATQVGQNGPYVFVVKPDSTVELRLIGIDRTINDKTVIASGLAAGERVVVDGQLRLGNGTRVNVQAPGGAPKRQAAPVAER